jgi:ribosome biogenesis GTPase / thiamine phosphate phosphatase
VRVVDGFGLIEEVEPRGTAFVRKGVGRASDRQVVAANVDVVFVVCGLDGDFNLRRLERYLLLAWESGARPVVVLNKADVCEDLARAVDAARGVAVGVEMIAIAARESVAALWQWLVPGATAVLLGSSGAGKSTIANALGAGELATQEVREQDSRGRHTTTARMLVRLANGSFLMDTPGMRELGVVAGEDALSLGFPEIDAYSAQCRFGDCGHGEEPGCAVRAALQAGEISEARWASYVKLQSEARYNARAADATAQRAEKQKWKAIHKAQKSMYRERGR